MPAHSLTNFDIQKYYQNKSKFNGVYSRNNLPKVKDSTYVKNLDEYKSTGTLWKALYINDNKVIYFEHIPKEIKRFIGNKNIITNNYIVRYTIYCIR